MKLAKWMLVAAFAAGTLASPERAQGLLGDVNFSDHVDAKDASLILAEYASQSTSQGTTFTDPQQKINADVDGNGVVDAIDAGLTLGYYAYRSTTETEVMGMETWLDTIGTGATGDGDPDAAVNKPVLTVTVDGAAGGKVFDPADARGKQVACTIEVSGANNAYAAMGFHVRYDARLALATEITGEIMVRAGNALQSLSTGTPVEDPTAPTGMKGFFVDSAFRKNYGRDGTMWTFSFAVPADAAAGDVYPIDIVASTTGTSHDLFVDIPVTAAGLDMQAYAFSKGVFSATNPNAFATGADVAACAALARIAGDADGYIAIADPSEPPVVSNVVARQRWPWNGLVDVDYEVGGGAEGLEARIVFQEQGGAGRTWVATNFLAGAEPSAEQGRHRATWDTAADGVTNVVAANVVATVCLEKSKYAELYLVTEDYKVSDDGTQILDHYEEPVDPANLPTRQTIEFGTEHTFKVIGAVPDAASPGSVLYSVVEDAEPVLATDADTIANAGFRVSVARTASAGDTATIQAVRHGVKSGAMTIAAVPYRSIFVCDGHMVLSDDGSKLYDPNWPDDPFTYADFLWGVNFSFGRFRGDDVPFLLIAVDTVQGKLVRIDVKDNPGDEDAKVLLSGANPECFTLNLAGSCVHIKADATDGAGVYVRARYRGLESDPQGFIITAH